MIGGLAREALRRGRRLLRGGPRPAILMYHRIAEDSFDPWGLAVAPDRFAEQLEWLSQNRTVLSLTEFATLHLQQRLPADAVALTFDDGYECVAATAVPLLQQARLPATVFIPAELIERGEPFWWDELQDIVLGSEGDSLTFEGELVPLGAKHLDDDQWKPNAPPGTSRQIAFHHIWAELREMTQARLKSTMDDLRSRASVASPRAPRPMRPEQVRATADAGIDIGSHALSHPWLTSLSFEEMQREIRDSVDACKRLSGRTPVTFAYPYGNFVRASEAAVENAGFACACATGGAAVGRRSHPFALPRVQVGNWSPVQLAGALAVA